MMDKAPATPPRTLQEKHQEYMRNMSPGTLNAYLEYAVTMHEIKATQQSQGPKEIKTTPHARQTKAKKPYSQPKPVRPFLSTLQSPGRLMAMTQHDEAGIELSPTKKGPKDLTPPSLRRDRSGLFTLATPVGAAASTTPPRSPTSDVTALG